MSGSELARGLAWRLLASELPRRWRHVQGVARRAEAFRPVHAPATADLLVAAGYAHDIGYAEPLRQTGFHPIDGARHLRHLGFDERLVSLVAHHTCASIEADLLDLGDVLAAEFPFDPTLPHDELLFCDLTTSPDGAVIAVEDRLDDVRRRYAPTTTVHRFVTMAEPTLLAASARARAKLEPEPSSPPVAAAHRVLAT